MIPELRKSIAARIEVALESACFLVSLFGASVAAAFGRILLAVLLAALALGIGFRLVGRQRRTTAQPRVAGWVKALSLVLAVLEVAALVEATDTPVRFHQEGFSYVHWVLVAAAVAIAYFVQVRAIAGLSRRFLPAP